MGPKGTTPYILFASQVRESVTTELKKNAADGKVRLADVTKEIGARWKGLSEEEKEHWKEGAKEQAENKPEAHDSDDERGGARGGRTATPGLPLSAVRKIVLIDEDIKRVTPAALHLVNRATDLFLRDLVARCKDVAEEAKRKTIKPEDMVEVVTQDMKREGPLFFLQDVLMGDVMPDILEMRRKAQESRPGKRHAEDEDGEEKPAAKRPQGKMHAFLAQQQST